MGVGVVGGWVSRSRLPLSQAESSQLGVKAAKSSESAENGSDSSEQEGEKSGQNADKSDQESASDENNTRDNGGSRDDDESGRGKEEASGDSSTKEALEDHEPVAANGTSSVSKDDASDSDDAPIAKNKCTSQSVHEPGSERNRESESGCVPRETGGEKGGCTWVGGLRVGRRGGWVGWGRASERWAGARGVSRGDALAGAAQAGKWLQGRRAWPTGPAGLAGFDCDLQGRCRSFARAFCGSASQAPPFLLPSITHHDAGFSAWREGGTRHGHTAGSSGMEEGTRRGEL